MFFSPNTNMPVKRTKKTARAVAAPVRASVKKRKIPIVEPTETKIKTETTETVEVQPVVTEQPKKKSFFSFSIGKKKDATVSKPDKKKGSLGQFFASINNIGMGKVRSSFIESIAVMMGAGLPLIDTLKTLQAEMRNRAMRKIIARITEGVESGVPLWKAMEEQYLFTPYELALVRIGEEAGSLAANLEYLSEQQEKDRALRAQIKMAMIYPTIVLVLMFIIVMGLGMFVLPNLVQVLVSLKAKLPLSTRIVIWVSNMFSRYGAIFVPASIAGFIGLALLARFTRLRVVAQWFIFHIPGIGALAKQATIARFGIILGGLLRAGVPLPEGLSSLADVTHIVAYKRLYTGLLQRITQGDSFSKSFADIHGSAHLLPISVQQLVVTGEQSGTLSNTLLKVAAIYERKASETAEKLPAILEPMLLIFIGSLVGTIAFSIIVPIYSVVGSIGR